MTWRPMTEHVFPWPVKNVILLVVDRDHPKDEPEVFRCRVGEHGAFFAYERTLSIIEQGWVPYAWREDDSPPPGEAWPLMTSDYLTEE